MTALLSTVMQNFDFRGLELRTTCSLGSNSIWHQAAPDMNVALTVGMLLRPEGYGGRGTDEGTSSQPQGLAGLFEPPHDILFQGSFDEAKDAAQGQSRWLVCCSSILCSHHSLVKVCSTALQR